MNRVAAVSVLTLGLLTLVGVRSSPAESIQIADRVVVRKAERKLILFKNTRVLKAYDIALGLVPRGHKEKEGDFRTPEGVYQLARRNPRSNYFLSIEISYPNNHDRVTASQLGVSPGGQIMIHGWPNELKHPPEFYRSQDWTDGCIAVSNQDMVEIWLMTEPGTPIEIRP